jgi:hypothetical protein
MDTPVNQSQSFAQFAKDYREKALQLPEGKPLAVVEFLSTLQTYKEGRNFCLANKDIVEDLLLDPMTARDTVLRLLDRPAVFTSPEQPEVDAAPIQQEKAWAQLEGSLPTRPASDATTEAFGIVQQALEKNKRETNRARSIVQEFNKRVTKIQAYGTSTDVSPAINEKKEGPLPTFEDIRKELQSKAAKNPQRRKEAETLLAEYEPFLRSEEYTQLRAAHTIVETVLETPEVPTKIFVEAVQQGHSKERAVTLAYTAAVVNTPIESGAAAASAQRAIIDVVTTVFPGTQHASLELMAANAWATVTSSNTGVTKLADAIGQQVGQAGTAIVQRPEFIDFIKRGNEAMAQRRESSSGALSGLGQAFNRPPVRIVESDVIDYAALMYQRDPRGTLNTTHVVAAQAIELIHLDIGGLPLELMAKWAARKEAGTAAKATIGAVTGVTAKQVGSALLTRLGFTALAGSAVATPIGGAVIAITSFFGEKAIQGAQYILSGRVFSSVFSDRGPDWKDTFFVAPFIMIAAIPVLFILATPLNVVKFDSNKERAAFVQNVGGADGGAAPPFFEGEPAINSDITACPSDGGYRLTQCPGGTFSHDHLDAYDIATPMGVPIYSTHAGVIAFAGFSPSGYGNLVIVKGRNTEGLEYSTYYGHLADIFVGPGQQVAAGETLGLADSTGNSTGSHLHYEYRENSASSPTHGVRFLLPTCGYVNQSGCQL